MQINLTTIAAGLNEARIPAYVEQTGGGCATIFVGPPTRDADGDDRYPLSVGPGSYDWNGNVHLGWTEDLGCGPDDDGQDDSDLLDFFDATGEREIVDAIIARYDRAMARA